MRPTRSRGAFSWLGAIATVATAVTITSCDSPAAPVRTFSVTVAPAAPSVIVGGTLQLAATPRDPAGIALSGRSMLWRSSSPGTASVSSSGLVTAVSIGSATVTASTDGQVGTAVITVLPIPVASILIAPGSATLIAGATRQFTGSPRDAAGNALAGRQLQWSVSGPETASIDAAGLLTAIAPGSVNVIATSEGQTATASVLVIPVPVASVAVSPSAASVPAGTTRTLTATARDAAGNVLPGRFFTWTTSAPTLAAVDAVGGVTAIALGTVVISATSEGQTGSATLVVTPGSGGPTVTAIAPVSLQPGTTVVINGVGFSSFTAANTVTIGGVAAPVLSATETQLMVSMPCVESGNATVRVTSNGVMGNALTRVVVVPQRNIGVGQALVLAGGAASVCNELLTTAGPARYLVAVFSASTSPNSLVDFEIVGNTPPAGTVAVRISAAAPRQASLRALEVVADDHGAQDAVHFAFLERDRRQYEQLRVQAAQQRSPVPRPAARAADLPSIHDMRSLYFTFNGGCSDTTRVMRGKAIYVGSLSIIWEDSANTLQSSANSVLAENYERIGRIFDQDQYASVRNNFGDPLLRDAVTDNDGRVHMIFSQRLNGSGAAAYVTSCDQYPTTVSRGSNYGQFFYGFVPTTLTLNLNSSASPDGWFYFMARTVVHEVKHIASISARVANNVAQFEQSWLEEGTARHAEELWVRESLHRVPWKGNTGFGTAADNGVFCDFSPADATCNAADPFRRPSYGMRRQFNEIREKLLEPWNWSPYGDATGQSSSTFYQTAWSLVRYTIDRYASSDAAFFRALVNASTNGVTNLSATAGVPMDQLIGGWGLALFADDYPGLMSPSADLQFATWNLRSIYAGLNSVSAWSTRWPNAFPIQPTALAYGSFVSRVSGLRGGAHAYFEVTGSTAGSQLVGLRSVSASAPSANLRVAIARLQ